MFQRIGPAAFKKDLSNTIELCHQLGNPQAGFLSIHIAGTNGKGSTAHMLAAVFTAAGFKTGLYTSPHYRDFRERIKIDGQLIPKQKVVAFVEKYGPGFEPVKPSFFEWTVALAFHYFETEKVDMAIIETGLGGRLDSTNILSPALSIITNIGYDHQQFLGETLPEIAGEKAGIIKPGVPVVIGETQAETTSVFLKKALELKAPIVFADRHFEAKKTGTTGTHTVYEVKKDGKVVWPNLQLEQSGNYQRKNLATVLQALETFDKTHPGFFPDLPAATRAGLTDLRKLTNFLGRWQLISQQPDVLIDSAHNAEGIQEAMAGLAQLTYAKLHVVLGMVSDKTHYKVLEQFPKEANYYFAKANIPRGLDAAELQKMAANFGLEGRAYASVRRALAAAKRQAAPEDLIFVGGSIFVVAEVV